MHDPREYQNCAPDGAVHAMGNGQLLVYGSGADITHVYGPVYSSASLLSARWSHPSGELQLGSQDREPGAGIWRQVLIMGDRSVVELVSAAVPGVAGWICHVSANVPVLWSLSRSRPGQWRNLSDGSSQADGSSLWAELHTAPDATVFGYPCPDAPVLVVIVRSSRGAVTSRVSDTDLQVQIPAGTADLLLVAAPDHHTARALARRVSSANFETLLQSRRDADGPTAQTVRSTTADWPQLAKWGAAAQRFAESGALAITAQQSDDGGIMAGYEYPLAYVRDQYGASRGLSALGLNDAAYANFDFRHRKYQRFGDLANAESMGHDGVRHRHENDEVELTSYHVLHAMELSETHPDLFSPGEHSAELENCIRVQCPHVVAGMLPFNGDETYVAGGILPRTTLNDGSFESTLLFQKACERLLESARLPPKDDTGLAQSLCFVQDTWRANFAVTGSPGLFYTNAPQRRHLAELPLFRPGVCEGCTNYPGWQRRTSTDRYVCPKCWDRPLDPPDDRRYQLLSASLLPFFIDPGMLSTAERTAALVESVCRVDAKGHLRSAPDSDRMVGYDAALLVMAAAAERADSLSALTGKLLGLADSTGTMSEYYESGRPVGVRCRPWETGVALVAVAAAVDALRTPLR